MRVILLILFLMAGGCLPAPRPPLKVADDDPSVKIPAIKKAVRKNDLREAEKMVEALQSDDPAVRFYAIEGLNKLTGETFGYEYYQTDSQRESAVKGWKNWLEKQKTASQTDPNGKGKP